MNDKQFDCVIKSIQNEKNYEFKPLTTQLESKGVVYRITYLMNKMKILRAILNILLRGVSLCFFNLMFPCSIGH